MKRFSRSVAALGLACTALSFAAVPAMASEDKYVQVGMLKCDVDGGVGLLLGSKKDMTCTFEKKDGDKETYTGHVLKVGIDIGITKESHITWAVFAPSGDHKDGALAGKYDGVGAEATVAGGIGANALFNAGKSVALQPFSVQDQKGANIAAGLEQLELNYSK